jgi:8-oxo-dGTP pyrophosphatase MutT (NUDIX family)
MSDTLKFKSPYYRVTVKALIFDAANKLLVTQAKDGDWEMPGGGWEHDETFAACVWRELQEELGAEPAKIGGIVFTYRGISSKHGHVTLRLVVPVSLKTHTFTPGDDMLQAKFVSQSELLALEMGADEAPIKECVEQIWPPVEKNASDL